MAYNYISSTVKLLEQYPQAAFAYSSVLIFDSSEDLEYQKTHQSKTRKVYQTFLKTGEYTGTCFIDTIYSSGYSLPVSPGCAIFRRENLHIIADIQNNMNYDHKKNGAGPDLLMFLEALAHGERFIHLCLCSSYFRTHQASISLFDQSIMDGYFLAKLYYLKKYGLNHLYADLNSEIISYHLGKHIFKCKRNRSVLEKYYEPEDFGITQVSIPKIIGWKLRRKKYYAKLSK